MSATISRDPFAREELHRATVKVYSRETTCRACGGVRQSWLGKLSLFRYFIETDGGTRREIPGLFCSIGCCRSYHG